MNDVKTEKVDFAERLFRGLDKVLAFGVQPKLEPEDERAAISENLLCLLEFAWGVLMLVDVFRFRLYHFAWIPVVTLLASLGAWLYSVRTGRSFLPSLIIISFLSFLFLFFVATGGTTHTGFILMFVFPALQFFTFSLPVSLVLFLSTLTSLAFILFLPGEPLLWTEYNPVLRHRIFFVYLFIGFAALAGRFVQWRSQKRIQSLMGKLVELSLTDQLTGLFNRRAFLPRLDYEVTRSLRGGFSMSLVMVDIDHFKAINDKRGHNCGDTALANLARTLRACLRAQDTVARWGGEEFLLLLPETDVAGAAIVAENLRAAVEKDSIVCDDESFSITISAGACQYDFAKTRNENIARVDDLLYQAKHEGRNRVCS